jgi:hypothetical protein
LAITSSLWAELRPQKQTLVQRFPWLWHDYVVSRIPAPRWAVALILVVTTYGSLVLGAAWSGDFVRLVKDPRWLFIAGLPVLASLALSYIPSAISNLWGGLKPWLANSDEEVTAFGQEIQGLLTRYFIIGALLWTAVITTGLIFGPTEGSWLDGYPNPDSIRLSGVVFVPVFGYFLGGGTTTMGVGLAMLTREVSRRLDLKRGFVLGGGKAALRPFSRLLFTIWASFTIPVTLLYGIAASIYGPMLNDQGEESYTLAYLALSVVPFIFFLVFLVFTIAVPHIFMNRLLAKEKSEELQALRQELAEVSSPAEGDNISLSIQGLQRQQYLLFQLQEAKAFSQTLVDTRLFLQISTSITGIVLASILLRFLLVR